MTSDVRGEPNRNTWKQLGATSQAEEKPGGGAGLESAPNWASIFRRCSCENNCSMGAIGAVVARFVHTEEVTGSNPVSPTKSLKV